MMCPNTEARLRYEIECAEANLRYEQERSTGEQLCMTLENELKSIIVLSNQLSTAMQDIMYEHKAIAWVLDGMSHDELASPNVEGQFEWLKEKIAERYAEIN